MTKPIKLPIDNMLEDDFITVKYLDPQPKEPRWIKNEAGKIIGYENFYVMTKEEVKELFDVTFR